MRGADTVVDVCHLERAIAERDPAWREAPRFVPAPPEVIEVFELAARLL
jgi:hypothetical protein